MFAIGIAFHGVLISLKTQNLPVAGFQQLYRHILIWESSLNVCFQSYSFHFSPLYFPFDLNNVQVNENGLSKDPSVKKKKVNPVRMVVVILRVEKF